MPDLWVWMDKLSDNVRSFMNPLLEVLQAEPVVEIQMQEARQVEQLIHAMPMDDVSEFASRPTLSDPDYVPDEFDTHEEAQEAIDNMTTVESEPTRVNAPYNPKPQTEVITVEDGVIDLGPQISSQDFTQFANGYDPLAHPNYLNMTSRELKAGPLLELQEYSTTAGVDELQGMGATLGYKKVPTGTAGGGTGTRGGGTTFEGTKYDAQGVEMVEMGEPGSGGGLKAWGIEMDNPFEDSFDSSLNYSRDAVDPQLGDEVGAEVPVKKVVPFNIENDPDADLTKGFYY